MNKLLIHQILNKSIVLLITIAVFSHLLITITSLQGKYVLKKHLYPFLLLCSSFFLLIPYFFIKILNVLFSFWKYAILHFSSRLFTFVHIRLCLFIIV